MPTTRPLPLLALLLTGCEQKTGGITVHNTAPNATIDTPTGGTEFVEGQTVTLRGFIGDDQDDVELLTATWSTSTANICADVVPDAGGWVECDWTAESGTSTLNLTAYDSGGKTDTDSVEITVTPNTAPTIVVSSPTEDAEYYTDIPVSLEALVDDEEDDEADLTVVWKSGDDALSVSGETINSTGEYTGTYSFEPGTHSLTATVTDSAYATGTDTVTITVFDVNTAPTCEFLSPGSGESFASGESILFEGSCTDAETAPTQLSVSLSSHIDGKLSDAVPIDDYGNFTLPWSELTPGEHVITVTAEDTPGASSTANITVTVCDTLWYADTDEDGYGDADSTTTACDQPSGYVSSDTDCDDTDSAQHPGADEYCNGEDDDCDGGTDEAGSLDELTWYADNDTDGYGDADSTTSACDQPTGYLADDSDCDDSDSAINPAATEVCDGEDNDCDGDTDDDDAGLDSSTATVYYADSDGDSYGDSSSTTQTCLQPSGYVEDASDCDDTDSAINPAATEVCDGEDNDCDGTTDNDDASDASTWYADSDGDTYGAPDSTTEACDALSGYVEDASDCDDTDSDINPAAAEVCDSIDNDCDEDTDEDVTDFFYADTDSDGYGDADSTTEACEAPTGYTDDASDCDDADSAIHPAAAEVCDGDDNDCDGETDEDDASDAATWYADSDGDTYGDSSTTDKACEAPSGYVSSADDCDDTDSAIHPAAAEVCDSIDNDCDGDTDEGVTSTFYADGDGDGYGDVSSTTDACAAPSGYVSSSDDCDDTDADVSPDAAEVCDSIDNDCDGDIDDDDSSVTDQSTVYADTDGDGFGDATATLTSCSVPSGYVSDDTDCDDTSALTYPGAASSDSASSCMTDTDGDGYGDDDVTGSVVAGSDCDDDDSSVSPDAAEVCEDTVDNDCDGTWNTCNTGTYDLSSDAYAFLYGYNAGSYAGNAIAFTDDVVGDSGEELFVSAFLSDKYGSSSGATYLIGEDSGTRELSVIAHDYLSSGTATNDYYGSALAAGGDFDGDGLQDVAVGAENNSTGGKTQNGLVQVLDSDDLGSSVYYSYGNYYYDLMGTSLAFVPDMDSDGDDELLIGAAYSSAYSGGVVWLVPGGSTGGSYVQAEARLEISAETSSDQLGLDDQHRGLSSVEFDGDGITDLLIGARMYNSSQGRAYLLFGATSYSSAAYSVGSSDVIMTGDGSSSELGGMVRGLGDMNGDDYEDLIVGSLGGNGEALIVFGSASPTGSMTSSDFDVSIEGDSSGDHFGQDAVSADFDQDGVLDLVITAVEVDGSGGDEGAAYLFYGPITAGSLSASDADLTLTGAAGDNLGVAVDAGDYDGDGFDDIAVSTQAYSSFTGGVYIWSTESF